MADFGETWSEEDFYSQPVSEWLSFLVPTKGVIKLEPLDLFTAASSSFNTYKKVENNIVASPNTDLNKRNHGGWTPLMYAAYYGYEEVVNDLLKNGAFHHPCNKMGKNVLMIAARCGLEVVVETVLKYGSILEARDNDDFTAIFHAVFSENHNVLEILLKYGANPNARARNSGYTPLMYAARIGSMDMTKILLKSGAFTTLTNNSGKTAAMIAKDSNFQTIADVIYNWKILGSSGPSLRDGPDAFEHRFTSHQQYLSPAVKISNSHVDSSACCVVVSDLPTLLSDNGLDAYTSLFKEQQVDLQIFLSMTDQELKECGVNKLGPRRKMIAAIERWYHNAPLRYGLEGAYANKVEVENQHLREKLAEMNMFSKMVKTRLDEANKHCRTMKAHLSSAMHITYSCYSFQPQNITGQLNSMSSLLEDIFRLTSPSNLSENMVKFL